MRKYVSMILALVLVFALAVPAAAADEECGYQNTRIDDVGLSFNIPAWYDVIRMDSDLKDPVFAAHKRDAAKMLQWMVDNNILVSALAPDDSREFRLYIGSEVPGEDFSKADEEYLQNTADLTAESYEKSGMEISETGYYMGGQMNYCYLSYYSPAEKTYVIMYFTVIDEVMVHLAYFSNVEPTEEEMAIADYAASTLTYDQQPVYFFNPEACVAFEAPAGCYPDAALLNEEVTYSLRLPKGSFGYFSYSDEEVADIPDADEFNKMSLADFSKLTGIPADQLDEETYAGQKYFIGSVQQQSTLDSKPVTLNVFNFLTCANGYMFHYQYIENAADNAVNLPVFEEILNSMDYEVQCE